MHQDSSYEKIIDNILLKLNNQIILATPLGAGKPNYFLNTLYNKAKQNPEINLTICTALTLQRPKGGSLLEQRFIDLFENRVFGDYPDLQYELDRVENKLPKNVEVIEFYFPPAKYLKNKRAQQHYICSNYTHVCRDLSDRGVNLIAQMVSVEDDKCSLSCNADLTIDLISLMRQKNIPSFVIGEVNQNLPFMYGECCLDKNIFDFLLDDPKKYFKIFGPPKMSIPDQDFIIGLYASSLVKDDGELQVGIGSLGDAVIYGLTLRQNHNEIYQDVLRETNYSQKFQDVITRLGDTATFKKGLFGATEMMVDGFKTLYENNILKKKVYDHIGIQRLINMGEIDPENLPHNILDILIKNKIIFPQITDEDLCLIKKFGILNADLKLKGSTLIIDEYKLSNDLNNSETYSILSQKYIGKKLVNGHIIHAGFFLGPENFYSWLKDLPIKERKLIDMRSVLKINQLYGHEKIDRLHRKNARFINTCMMTTLSGAHVSDGIGDGRVVSGVGGQFNFVAMAQELPDGHSILTMRSTRIKNGKVYSNIVKNYPHITVPRHMRDVLITEYGIAFLRGKTDAELIQELLKVCDSRFQGELLKWAKKSGKINSEYEIPIQFKNNFPHTYEDILKKFKKSGYFPKFPFGTSFTEDELKIGAALKNIVFCKEKNLNKFIGIVIKSIFSPIKKDNQKLLQMMKLDSSSSFIERIYAKILNYFL
ncbi:MAG: hypothetical protein H6622_11670 [Halobacteriovoraceae bacterium]|nr:hypothetical protein [Halobacteriovoraceae bacterium]